MLFLWIFGNNIEDSMNRGLFVVFYLAGGLVAMLAQTALDTDSMVPTLGASGAIAAVLGAYALLYPRARVLTLVIIVFFVTILRLPALLVLGAWFLFQLLDFSQVASSPDGRGRRRGLPCAHRRVPVRAGRHQAVRDHVSMRTTSKTIDCRCTERRGSQPRPARSARADRRCSRS